MGLLRMVGVGLLGQRGLGGDVLPKFPGQWFDGLKAPDSIRRVDLGGAEGKWKLRHQGSGLCAALGVQWTLTVVALVPRLAAGGAVADDQHGLGVGGLLGELRQHLAVVRMVSCLVASPGGSHTISSSLLGVESPPLARAPVSTILVPTGTR